MKKVAKTPDTRHKNRVSRETEALLNELKRWCELERGRKATTARNLKIPSQLLSDWFARRKTPTWEQGLRIQAFLEQIVRN
jgi:hypothetical protein